MAREGGSFIELALSTSHIANRSSDKSLDLTGRGFWLAFGAITVCGTFNNLVYCIISGASQNLAKYFGTSSYMTLLSGCMNTACLAATFLNARFMIQKTFYWRIRLILVLMVIAYAGVAASALMHGTTGFAVASLFSCLAGIVQVFGEMTNLAFLKAFPPELIGGWGAGTGIAGIAGGGMYILLNTTLGLSNTTVFSLMVVTVPVYWCAFHYLHSLVATRLEGPARVKAFGGSASNAGISAPLADAGADDGALASLPLTCTNARAAFKVSGSIMFSMVAVYCLEYMIYPGLDDRETLCNSKAWYTVMWIAYNVGVTISRLSVALFRIRRVWLLTFFQTVNVVGWTIEVYTGAIRNSLPNEGGLYIVTGWMVLVGLCGGATYGNCMYLFNEQEGIPDQLRELGINIGFIMSNIGITFATYAFILFDNSIMTQAILYPDTPHIDQLSGSCVP